jgi:uncharacterized protein DUF1572
MSSEAIVQNYFEDALKAFRAYKKLAEKAIAQLRDEEFFVTLDEEANSVAVIMKHMAGNMLSRWTDFLSSDGEKPDRNRDAEFEDPEGLTQEALLERWSRGWECLFAALSALGESDLERQVTIRSQPHSVVEAINRQLAHYALHTGQIVFLAKHLAGGTWRTLSIPRGGSAAWNAAPPKPTGR